MSDHKEITILMATYNGEAYLKQQLDSILTQTYTNWKLVIRDDGSTDGTLGIITSYLQKDERISLICFGDLHGSACKNFSQLAEWAVVNNRGTVMFSDQDDIWKQDKIAVSVAEINLLEQQYGADIPLLCYSAFQFINEQGIELPQKLQLPAQLDLRVLLNENHAWGCTMILNPAALKAIVPVPENAVNHDYWIALVVAGLGKTKLIDQDLILYRQHTNNVSGNVDNMSFAKRFNRYITNQDYMIGSLAANLKTVTDFYSRYKDQLSNYDQKIVNEFIINYHKDFSHLIRTLLKYRIFKIGFAKNAVYFYTLLLLQKKVVKQLNSIP